MVVNGGLYVRFKDSLLFASDATSSSNTYIENIIVPYLGDNIIGLWLEYIIVVIRLSMPLELISLGIKYWPFILYQVLMTYYAVKGIVTIRENSSTKNIALLLYFAFLFASASFEVDYGSWIRHCAVTFPILLVMVGIVEVQGEMEISMEEDSVG